MVYLKEWIEDWIIVQFYMCATKAMVAIKFLKQEKFQAKVKQSKRCNLLAARQRFM